MTVSTPTPEPEDGEDAKAVVEEALEIVRSEAETAQVETVFVYAAKVGAMLLAWRKMMIDGGFSKKYVEEAAMTLFEKFFTPFVPEYHMMHGAHDDDDD